MRYSSDLNYVEYSENIMHPMWRRFTGLGESIRIFEEYSVSKYGDYLGNKRLKTLFVAEVTAGLLQLICCD